MDAMNFPLVRPVTLPSLRASQAQALTLVALHGASVRISLPAAEGAETVPQDWLLSLSPSVPETLRQAAGHRVDLKWAGASLRVRATPGALLAWVNARLPSLDLEALPEALQEAALETALGEALAALEPLAAADPPRVASEATDVSLPHVWTFSARSLPDGDPALLVLEADDLGLMLLARLLKQANPDAPGGLDDAALPMTLRAELGRAVLPLSELRSLAGGDVILLDEYLVDQRGELWLCVPQGQGVRVRAEHSSYLVTQGWTTLMNQNPPAPDDRPPGEPDTSFVEPDSSSMEPDTSSMEPDSSSIESAPSSAESDAAWTETDAPAPEPLALDAVPVRLTFDLGDRILTLSELRRLQPGAVFDLRRPLTDGPVMIRANGALLGTGTLVDVDGRIGVCIATLGKAGA